jgi:hypothetical protein
VWLWEVARAAQKECPCSGGREGLRAPVLIGCD